MARALKNYFYFFFCSLLWEHRSHWYCFWCWMIQKLAISKWALLWLISLTLTDGRRGNTISVLGPSPSLRESLRSIGRKLPILPSPVSPPLFSPAIIQWIPPYLITIPLTDIAFILSNQKSQVSSYFPPSKSSIFYCNIKGTLGIGLRCSKEAVRWLKEASGQT